MVKSFEEILERIDAVDTVHYERTRNHLAGAVSRLSPYISRGIITLPFVRDRILEKSPTARTSKFLQELAWREYFQVVWQEKGEAIFDDLRFKKTDMRHAEIVTAIANGTTGIKTLDAAIAELYTTGYLHNHNRLFLASVACHVAKADWISMGKWMYAYLYDGDLASNFLSWQWVAGTSVSKQYYANQSLINSWSPYKETGTWLDVPLEAIKTMECPPHLRESFPFSLTTKYPLSEYEGDVHTDVVLLYTPWTLDPVWRNDLHAAKKVLVIDPQWFDRFPVSGSVMNFIVAQGKQVIPTLQIFVGSFDELVLPEKTYYKKHPTTIGWNGQSDEIERLFPEVTGYHPSFFSFWKAVTEKYHLTQA